MSERDHERRLEDELANMTDTILSDRNAQPATGELRQYDDIVRGLHALLHEDGPSEAFERRLSQRLDHEWAQRAARRPGVLRLTPVSRMLAAAAAVLLLVGVVALISPEPALQATVVGEFGAGVLIGVGALVAVGVIAYLAVRRR